MKKIVFIPLDERPCNLEYPLRLFKNRDDITVVYPPKSILGKKKIPANIEQVRKFIVDQISGADILVFATEMLAYGGLLPSRIYSVTDSEAKVAAYRDYVIQLKKINPQLVILASNLIMRTPRYSSNDEEPDYYGEYGAKIFRYGWLIDQKKREVLSPAELNELETIKKTVPQTYIYDYEQRRAANLKINMANMTLVKSKVIDYLAIPQDDSAPYGYTAMDQTVVYSAIKQNRLQNRVGTYPGADETGYTLLARAVQIVNKRQYKIYPFFASAVGQLQIPLYEDRPMVESVKSHILSAGAEIAATPATADIILAVNTPGKKMIEAREQLTNPDVTYDTFRNLRAFVSEISGYLATGKLVAVADSAYANGGDLELISMLDEQNLFNQIGVYRGWNTNCNTVGSAIGSTIIQLDLPQEIRFQELINNLIDDVFYQTIVRKMITDDYLPKYNMTYFDLKSDADQVATQAEKLLHKSTARYLRKTLTGMSNYQIGIEFPWNRMFEVNCQLNSMED